MNNQVDNYLLEGCGRCELYQTPGCKVHSYTKELKALRKIMLESGLKEEFKWKQPCYSLNGKNVIILSAFKDYAFLSFFKGSLLKDANKLLHSPGKNSQAARQLRFTDVKDVHKLEPVIRDYIQEAIELQKSGANVAFKAKEELEYPVELLEKFKDDEELKEAFENLTPGRQRSYILHYNNAKQTQTRINRIEKSKAKILAGKGFNEY